MKANELRIGNLIRFNNLIEKEKIVTVTGRFLLPFSEDVGDISNYYQPIPLTEEWLLKFGFEKIGEYWYKDRFFIEMLFGRLNLRITINNAESAYANSVQYVHQLQNLYFALTGNELEIK
jgi:hypothetical protein